MNQAVEELQKWRKIGGGSLRWNGRIIKPGQIFYAYEGELPSQFMKHVEPIQSTFSEGAVLRKRNTLSSLLMPDVVFLLGGGPSLAKIDLGMLKGQYVIAINRAYEIYPEASMLFFADHSFFEEHQEGICASPIPVKATAAKRLLGSPEFLTVNRDRSTKRSSLIQGNGTVPNTNSGLMAANLAFQLGAKLVVLLGMDLKEVKGRKHWHDGYSHPSPPKTCSEMLSEWKGVRSAAWRMFGGDLLHGTPGSELEEIPYVPLPKVLERTQEMLYFGGWWLPRTEQHFRGMLKSSREYEGRLTYQTYNKLFPALEFLSPGKRDGVAIDVGANVGFWSYPLSDVFSKVHCFEPSPLHCRCWKLNMAGKKNVKLYPFGIDETERELAFSSPPTSCGGTHVGLEAGEDSFTAKVFPLDSFPELRGVSFLKVDCEGYELPILRGAENLLRREHPLIVVEQKAEWEHRFPFPSKGAVHFLESLGAKKRREIQGDYILSWD